VWLRRGRLPGLPDEDLMFVGKPLLDACVGIGGSKGKTFLSAVAQIDRGQLGVVAGVLAGAIPRARVPPWITRVGEPTPITRAFSASGPGDEQAVLLQTDPTGAEVRGGIDRLVGLLSRPWALLTMDPWAGRRRHRRQLGGWRRCAVRSAAASC
jgi:hypothetical protein